MHGSERLGGIADTDTVVVQGAGPVGLFAVAKAVCEGASRVIAIGGPKTRLDLATSWGATPSSTSPTWPRRGNGSKRCAT
jgi:threonine dehydrogenase-like Zn-dependent dehydrogenase